MFFGNPALRSADPKARIVALRDETAVRRVKRAFLQDKDSRVVDAAATRLVAIMSPRDEDAIVGACLRRGDVSGDRRRRLDRLILAEARSGFGAADHVARRFAMLSVEGLADAFGLTADRPEWRDAALDALADRGRADELRRLLRGADGTTRAAGIARVHPINPHKAERLCRIHDLIADLDAADAARREAAESALILEPAWSVPEVLLFVDDPAGKPAAPVGIVIGCVRILAGIRRLRRRFPEAVEALRQLGESVRDSRRAELRPFGAVEPSALHARLRDEVGDVLEKFVAPEFTASPDEAVQRDAPQPRQQAPSGKSRRDKETPGPPGIITDDSIAPGGDYGALARQFVARHGPLRSVAFRTHFPDFEIDFEFEAGTLKCRQRHGVYDIHFLSLGYAGEGPSCAHAFLRGAGFELAYDEITELRPGAVIRLENGRATVRYPRDPEAERRHRAAIDATKLLDLAQDSRLDEFKALVADDPRLVDFVRDEGAFQTPILIHAIKERQVKTAVFLIEAGADIDRRYVAGNYAYSAFSMAVDQCWDFWAPIFKPLIDTFLERRPDVETDDFIVSSAVRQEHDEVLQYLVERGKPLDKAILSIDWNSDGANRMCDHLLALGADIDAVDTEGKSALWHVAVRYRKAAAVRRLLDLGADPDLVPTGGNYPRDREPAIEATDSEEVRSVLAAHRRA